MPTNKTEWVKLTIVIVVACITVSTTTAGGTWFIAKRAISNESNHVLTDAMLIQISNKNTEQDKVLAKHTNEINELKTMLSVFSSSLVRVEANQTKQIDKTQEMAEGFAGLEAYLKSFTVEDAE